MRKLLRENFKFFKLLLKFSFHVPFFNVSYFCVILMVHAIFAHEM